MNTFICVAPTCEVKDVNNKSLGMEPERALYFSIKLGRQRIYGMRCRTISSQKEMTLLIFETTNDAQKTCDSINEACGDNFKVELICLQQW